jgi:deoxyribonuclease-4
MWSDGRRQIDPGQAAAFRERRLALGLDPVVIHANYLINLAAPDRHTRALSIRGFRGELERAIALGADYLVVHPGSRRESKFEDAVERIGDSLRQAAEGLDLGRLRVLIEITAGQGSVVGSHVGELRAILDACPELDLGVCLDTAHLLAAGYEIRTAAGLDATLEEIDRAIGLGRVRVVHVNDSRSPLGSRVDRHEHLGRGHIGLDAMGRIVNHPRLAGRAFLLETPIDRPGDDWRNVRALWRLAGVEWKRPAGAGDGFRPRRQKTARGRPRKRGR